LTSEESFAFADACARSQNHSAGASYAVGYYRSDTREGLGGSGWSLGPEDLELMKTHFQAPSHVALLIRPNATKASLAGFFLRDGGQFPQTSPLTFPFRRWDLTGEEPPARRSITDRRRDRGGPELVRSAPRENGEGQLTAPDPGAYGSVAASDFQAPPFPGAAFQGAYAVPPAQTRMWMPLSFLFLILGVGLGFLLATFSNPKTSGTAAPASDFSLGLSVAKSGDNLIIHWNRNAPAIRSAQMGELEIDDSKFSPKPQDLDAAHLDNGTIIYKNSSKVVRLTLRVFENSRVTVEQTAEWQEP
jgi:hypothetical protein